MVRFFILLAAIFCHITASCQQAGFIIAIVKGNAYVIEKNKKIPIKAGLALQVGETIALPAGSYVVAVNTDKGYAKLQRPGIYNIDTMEALCRANASPAALQIAGILAADATGNSLPKKMEEIIPAGACSVSTYQALDTINYYQGDMALTWMTQSHSPVTLNIYKTAQGGQPVLRFHPRSSSYALSLFKDSLLQGQVYYWAAETKLDRCPRQRLHCLYTHPHDSLVTACWRLVRSIADNPAAKQWLMGRLLEQNHLYAEAWEYYKQVAAADPYNKLYKDKLAVYEKVFGDR